MTKPGHQHKDVVLNTELVRRAKNYIRRVYDAEEAEGIPHRQRIDFSKLATMAIEDYLSEREEADDE